MNKIAFILIASFYSQLSYAQDTVSIRLKSLLDQKKYDYIIEKHGRASGEYSAQSLYFIGIAYYMKEDDNNSIKLMDLSIAKDPKNPDAHFIKGRTLNYLRKFNEAVQSFQAAIALDSAEARFYSGLGDAYYELRKYEIAIEAYRKAIQLNDPEGRPYSMLAQSYNDLKDEEKALAAYYVAKDKVEKGSDAYKTVLFNIGLKEALKRNFGKAEEAYLELLILEPEDYHLAAKLIQVYYGRGEHDKAKPYKQKLYDAYKQGLLKDNLKDMYCFDQFKWKDKSIQVYERFEESTGKIYNKHLFYIINAKDEVEFRIQTEYSPFSVELKGPKYLLCMSKGNTHYTYNIGFADNFKYEDLKHAVVEILEGKIQPAASSRVGN